MSPKKVVYELFLMKTYCVTHDRFVINYSNKYQLFSIHRNEPLTNENMFYNLFFGAIKIILYFILRNKNLIIHFLIQVFRYQKKIDVFCICIRHLLDLHVKCCKMFIKVAHYNNGLTLSFKRHEKRHFD